MSETTRFDRRDDISEQQQGGETRRMLPLAHPPLLCLRCRGVMVPTRVWSFAAPTPLGTHIVGLTLLDEQPYVELTAIGCTTMSCVDCGYTELYADTGALRQRLNEAEKNNSPRKRRSRR